MRYVGDESLKNALGLMIDKLLSGETPFKINFRIVQRVYFLGQTWIAGNDHRVVINQQLGKIIRTNRGLRRAYAVLGHEIGHVLYHNDCLKNGMEIKTDLESLVSAEKEADKHAMRMLGKIYPDPKEILLDQISYALKISLKHAKTEEKKELAKTFAKERRLSLSKLG